MNPTKLTSIERVPNLLRDRLAPMHGLIAEGRPVVFFDYAVYYNVGDLLISKGIERFFALNKNKVIDQFAMQNYTAALERSFHPDALFVFQGGGNFGDLFAGFNQLRMRILEAHPDRSAVILPQTLFYREKKKLEEDARALSRFRNLTICLRDQVSYDVAKERFDNIICMLPDTAHYLQDAFGNHPATGGTLKFLRQDQAAYSVTGLAGLPEDRSDLVDWPTFLNPIEKAGLKRFAQLHKLDARIGHTRLPYMLYRPFRDRILRRAARLFLASDQVITSRLHGLIFSIICRRRATIVETGYGKVSAYYDTWLKSFENIELATPGVHKRGMAGMGD